MAISLLSLVGTPPTAVFIGKLTTFTAAWDGGFAWLVAVDAVNTVASLFYYLRWVAPVFATGQINREFTDPRPAGMRTALVGAVVILVLGIGSGALGTISVQ